MSSKKTLLDTVRRALSLHALLTLGGGGGVKFCLLGWVNFTLGPISAIRRAPTHKDAIEQGVLRTVLSA